MAVVDFEVFVAFYTQIIITQKSELHAPQRTHLVTSQIINIQLIKRVIVAISNDDTLGL